MIERNGKYYNILKMLLEIKNTVSEMKNIGWN